MRILLPIISLLLSMACSTATTSDFDRIPDDEIGEGLVSIAYLKTLNNGRSTMIDKDVSVEGTVIANDLFGEFYKTIVISDDSGGIEISIDKIGLYNEFPLYSQVAVFCHGLALGRVGGKITLGARPTGEYATDRIAFADIDRYISLFDHRDMSDFVKLTIAELSVEHVSALVLIENLNAVESERGLPWCDPVSADENPFAYTDRHFEDAAGRTLTVRTINNCRYRDEPIPAGGVSLAGVVDYSDGEYFLRIVNHSIFLADR